MGRQRGILDDDADQYTDPAIRLRLHQLEEALEDQGLDESKIHAAREVAKGGMVEQLWRQVPGQLGLTGRQPLIVTLSVCLLLIVAGVVYGGYRIAIQAHEGADAAHERLTAVLVELQKGQATQTEVLRSSTQAQRETLQEIRRTRR